MAGQLRVYRQRARAVRSTQKITKAMELIAASRIAKAQARMRAARPYAEEMTNALAALGGNASLQHPMLTGVENPKRAGILVITSDRGLAGGYSSNAIKRANDVAARIESEGKEPVRYVIGRKGVGYYRFRRIEVAGAFTGFSEQPSFDLAREAIDTVVAALLATSERHVHGDESAPMGIDELYLVSTRFENSVTQIVTASKISPVQVEQTDDDDERTSDGPQPQYDFEPDASALLDSLLPRYVGARIYSALLESATSESAARRQAMKSASDNADELIKTYVRLANQARQAEITQEISEIVGGADALASAGGDDR
ncbi:F0F1 ATP synthase subunit gamma [Jatrophihabitans sp. YIM 134969]